MGAKEARLLREQHVSEDPAKKRLVLSKEAEAVPAESERSRADIPHTQSLLKLTRPVYQKKSGTYQGVLVSATLFNDWISYIFSAEDYFMISLKDLFTLSTT